MLWPWKSKRSVTAPLKSPDTAAPEEPVACLLSDVGCCRESNEDSAKIIRAGFNGSADRGFLVVVADGMGGYQAGEVASQTAVAIIEKEYPTLPGTSGDALEKAFHKAHQAIFKMAQKNSALAGMGTTCTALAIVGRQAWAVHVGDSRLYLARSGEIYQLSEDHTQCMQMVRNGLMTLEEAKRHEDRNVLIHAMGTREELAPMTWPESMMVRPRDVFVLCSDGLHDLVSNAEILEAVKDTDPSIACPKLVKMARDRGGYDNITLAVVAIPSPDGAPAALKVTGQYEVNK